MAKDATDISKIITFVEVIEFWVPVPFEKKPCYFILRGKMIVYFCQRDTAYIYSTPYLNNLSTTCISN